MFSSKEAMMSSIASIDNQIAGYKSRIESLRAQKKTYMAMKTVGGCNTATNIQKDIEYCQRNIKELQQRKKDYKAQGYRK